MPKYTVRWSQKTAPGRGVREFELLGNPKRPKGKGSTKWSATARAFAQAQRRKGFKNVSIYDARSGKSKTVT